MQVEPGTLYVVATPIGNLQDLSPRAAEVLRACDLLLCEDTRHTARLLTSLALKKPSQSLHAHNERARIPAVIERLQAGAVVALVSDAGTPVLSDPGEALVAAVQDAGLAVRTVPGPFAVAAALAAAGLVAIPFAFWGFLPKKALERRQFLDARLQPGPGPAPMTHAFYVPGRDLATTAADLAELRPTARVVVARELTKLHEGYLRAAAAALPALLREDLLRGEAVLLVEVAELAASGQQADVHALVAAAKAAGQDRKTATRAICLRTGLSRNEVYAVWLGA